jgi:lipoprotein LprG
MSRSSFTDFRTGVPTRRTVRALAAAACLAALAFSMSACSNKSSPTQQGPLPAGADLMSKSETAMSSVQTVHFVLIIDGSLPNIPISKADGDLTKGGDAKGTATVSVLGSKIETEFVIAGGQYYIKGPTGGFQQVGDAAAVGFDPSSILDPTRGMVHLMQTATGVTTQSKESVNGRDAYKLSATADPTAVAALIPGASGNIPGELWIDASTYQVLQGTFQLPGSNGKTVPVTIQLSNFDAPVTISAPTP